MPVHVTTSTTQTITGNKTFTGLVSSSTGFTFPDGTTQTSAFTGVTIPPSDRLNNGTVQVVLSSDNNLIFPGGGYIGSQYGAPGWIVTPAAAGGIASADGEQYIQINNGQGIFIGTNWPSSAREWTFGRDGRLTFPDGSIQTRAFTEDFVALSGGNINGNLTVNGALSVTTLCAASANIAVVNITQYELSGFTVSGDLIVSGTLSTNNPIYVGDRSSNNWNDAFATVQSNSSTAWNYQGTDVKNLTANWQSTFNTVSSASANWNDTRSVVQTNSAQWATDIATDAGVRSLTSNWQDTYSTVQNNSASNWNYQGTDVKNLTANWQTSYTILTSTSADWNNTRSVVQSNSAQWATDSTTDTGVRSLTSNWQNTYSTVQSNSATEWNYQGTDVKNLTANWQNTYNTVSSTSANWNDTRNTVQSNSASWAIDNSTDTGVRELTSNWQSSYTALTSTSANWNDTRSTVQNNSAVTWNYQGTDVKSLTSSWQNTYTTFSAQSANNLSVYSTVNANSATWGTGGGGAGGGLTIFSEVSSVTSPNNTIPTFGLSAKSLSADVDFAIIPKGSGALLAQIPDGTYVGGNKRGLYATDWQRFRAVASQVASAYATIGGGISNTASGEYSTIGGGGINIASSDYATVGGGTGNTASSAYATIGGGTGNTASGAAATIGGGENNIASSDYATIGSGANNTASGEYATIGGGANNIASGANSFIAGGFENNTNNQANTFILGSNIIAPSANYTYVNNLSSQGDIRVSSTIYSASGNSNQWNSTYSTVNANSATWVNGIYEEIWIGAGAMISPTLSGAASTTLPITGSGNAIYVDAFNFDAAVIEYAQFTFLPPTNCNRSSFKCQFSWTASTTGSVSWNIQSISLSDSNSIDIAWGGAQEAIDSANGSTTFQITSATNTISPSGTINNNSMMQFRAYRNVNSASDVLAVDASLLGIRLQYMVNGGLSASW